MNAATKLQAGTIFKPRCLALSRVVERGPDKACPNALSFILLRHLRVREYKASPLMAVLGYREPMIRW